ncbi:MAG: hypothetical protein HUJ68_11050 [Clostridia bacterium]|nr:hypothetical protein [Clostridia bacterium]
MVYDDLSIPLKDDPNPLVIRYDQRSKITGISIQNCSSTDFAINDSFLSQCEYLDLVNLYGIKHEVKSVGNNFLFGCTRLQSVDLSPFDKVTAVGDNFMRSCSSLQFIEMYL